MYLHGDAEWLDAAARLAIRARPLSRPNPSVGAIIVRDGRVQGRGWTKAGGRPHAEAVALAQAGPNAAGATLYTTLEPCAHASPRGPTCADLCSAAELKRAVIGLEDPDPRTAGSGIARLVAAGVAVTVLDRPPVRSSLAGYLCRARYGRPHVTLKLATSLDGCIALENGESRWITGEDARRHVHSRRAMADAILVGGETWRTDRPSLDVRLPGLKARSPRRLVLTRKAAPGGIEAIGSPSGIHQLGDVQYLYVEGGAQTAAAFLQGDLVDTLHLYQAPVLIGAGRQALGDIGLSDLAAAHERWAVSDSRQLGSDRFTAYERIRSA
ncbi:bifunctional diaminohydroxyphosphoribosylaminopyrimidine deaminase/5-amino-6-(5-phosphoribosylamino)uracil reductase RibD [Pseudopontixanthobacter vadosimaris]|uniref:bifunctional diaminohydroxyphosphoribosylaminopyrimidine deaminase/5-amino-6-(5-phosphoribosylamino)uracil reductase RibD n=1 Tax=Pseudopontixanthobacter vadosimaris TaxID=2726450 RepID=UPI0014734534|nr:bifunctional diaminohydroxyphosphoribosylaminopyrimidine deaminase/5-amino-6-(5-phosphoribosylamino)uracil reductase RibD [Pseudopontixanthobacter vadosimaris]